MKNLLLTNFEKNKIKKYIKNNPPVIVARRKEDILKTKIANCFLGRVWKKNYIKITNRIANEIINEMVKKNKLIYYIDA